MALTFLILLLAATLGGLSGCSTAPATIYVPQEVKVLVKEPVVQPPTFATPTLPIANITATTPDADVVRAYAASITKLKQEIQDRDAALNVYRTKQPATSQGATQ